jgi:hypothetical protein
MTFSRVLRDVGGVALLVCALFVCSVDAASALSTSTSAETAAAAVVPSPMLPCLRTCNGARDACVTAEGDKWFGAGDKEKCVQPWIDCARACAAKFPSVYSAPVTAVLNQCRAQCHQTRIKCTDDFGVCDRTSYACHERCIVVADQSIVEPKRTPAAPATKPEAKALQPVAPPVKTISASVGAQKCVIGLKDSVYRGNTAYCAHECSDDEGKFDPSIVEPGTPACPSGMGCCPKLDHVNSLKRRQRLREAKELQAKRDEFIQWKRQARGPACVLAPGNLYTGNKAQCMAVQCHDKDGFFPHVATQYGTAPCPAGQGCCPVLDHVDSDVRKSRLRTVKAIKDQRARDEAERKRVAALPKNQPLRQERLAKVPALQEQRNVEVKESSDCKRQCYQSLDAMLLRSPDLKDRDAWLKQCLDSCSRPALALKASRQALDAAEYKVKTCHQPGQQPDACYTAENVLKALKAKLVAKGFHYAQILRDKESLTQRRWDEKVPELIPINFDRNIVRK